MNKVWRPLTALAERIRWVVLIKVALSMVILVYAASITATSNNYQAEIGSVTTVASGLKATDKGFSLATTGSSASATGTTCTTPTVFAPSPGVANNAIVAGNLVYDVQINQTTIAPPAAKFNVTFVLGPTAYAPLCIQTLATPLNSQLIDCKFDLQQTSLPSSPFSFKVTVQQTS